MELDLEKYILKTPPFNELIAHGDLESMNASLQRKEFTKGAIIFRETTFSKGVYIIRKGKVKTFQTGADGKQSIVHVYRKGDFLGHRPILGDLPHPVSAAAMDDVVVSFLPREAFLNLLVKSEKLSRSLLAILSREFVVWVNKLTVFAQYNVKKRVALSLYILSKVFEKRENTDQRTVINMGRDDFAGFVGTAKETLVRTLRFFKDEGIISTYGTKIVIVKPRKLKSLLEEL